MRTRGTELPLRLCSSLQGGIFIREIKEKSTDNRGLKEKKQAIPKELVRRGLEDGARKLRGQLRETAQRGQTSDYGGDQSEDTAGAVGCWAVRRIEKQLKRIVTGRGAFLGPYASPPMGPYPAAGSPMASPESGAPMPGVLMPKGRMELTLCGTLERSAVRPVPPAGPVERSAAPAPKGMRVPLALPAQKIPPVAERAVLPEQGRVDSPAMRRQDARTHAPGMRALGQVETGLKEVRRGPKRFTAAAHGRGREITAEPSGGSLLGAVFPSAQGKHGTSAPGKNGLAGLKKDLAERGGSMDRPAVKTVRTNGKKAEYPPGQAVKTRPRTPAETIKTAERAFMRAPKARSYSPREKSARSAARVSGLTARPVPVSPKAGGVRRAKEAVPAVLRRLRRAARELAGTIAAGGWAAAVVLLMLCVAGMLIASPFGLFFSGSGGGHTVAEAVYQLDREFSDRLEELQRVIPHDALDLDGGAAGAMRANWRSVLAVFAVRTAGDGASPGSAAVLDDNNMEILREVYWDMNQITHFTEYFKGGDGAEHTILHIAAIAKDAQSMADEYGFSAGQREMLAELMGPQYTELFQGLTGSGQELTLSPEEVREILSRLPEGLSQERRQVVLTAYQLLGKVEYFWGGKSLVLGWDPRWGRLETVWAAGSATTGTMRAYGLDCSGFVDWVFYNVSGGTYVIGHGGGAHLQHVFCDEISWEDVQPGDLAFFPGDSHVGIVCGFDENGEALVIHCSYSAGRVVVTGRSGFTAAGTPQFYSE